MSICATQATWNLTKETVSSSEKLLLLSLADRSSEQGICWPSIKRLAYDTCLDIKTIKEARRNLIQKGLLIYTGERKGRTKSIPVMKLTYVKYRYQDDQFDNELSETSNGSAQNLSESVIGLAKQAQKRTTESKRDNLKDMCEKDNNNISRTRVEPKPTHSKIIGDYQKQELGIMEKVLAEGKEQLALTNENKLLFEQKFKDRLITIEQLFVSCQEYWDEKGITVGAHRFKQWIQTEKLDNHPKINEQKSTKTYQFDETAQDIIHQKRLESYKQATSPNIIMASRTKERQAPFKLVDLLAKGFANANQEGVPNCPF